MGREYLILYTEVVRSSQRGSIGAFLFQRLDFGVKPLDRFGSAFFWLLIILLSLGKSLEHSGVMYQLAERVLP